MLVWAYKPLKETNNETGFVWIDDNVAEKLIKSGDIQDPSIGANNLNYIQLSEDNPKDYSTKELKAKK